MTRKMLLLTFPSVAAETVVPGRKIPIHQELVRLNPDSRQARQYINENYSVQDAEIVEETENQPVLLNPNLYPLAMAIKRIQHATSWHGL